MKNQNNNDELKFENELLKLKLTAESGAHFSETKLPPKMENDWLQYIIAYEDAAKEKRMIKVFDKLEKPNFSLVVTDEELPSELNRLLDHLHKYNIEVCTLCEVSDRELYRFIVEDLFEVQMNEIRFDGIGAISTFTYEDFHPNHPYDISNRIDEFIDHLIKQNKEYCTWGFSSDFISVDGSSLKEDEVKKRLVDFFNSYAAITLETLQLKELNIENDLAIQHLFIKFTGNPINSHTPITYEGEGIIKLFNDYGWWGINGINIPGIKI